MDLKTVVYLATRFGGVMGLPPGARELIGKWGPLGIEIYQAVAPIIARHAQQVAPRAQSGATEVIDTANTLLRSIGKSPMDLGEAQQLENAWMDRATRSGIDGN